MDGSVLEAGKGEPFDATVNGEKVTELDAKLASGDVVEIGNGGPIEEPSDSVETTIPWTVAQEGNGAIHLVEGEGKDGVKATKTGKVSGITAEQVVQEPSNIVRRNVSPDVGDDKVIALTFDDGPWGEQTGQVLDVLAEHGAKATFFTVGNRIEQDNGDAFIKRAVSEGHPGVHAFLRPRRRQRPGRESGLHDAEEQKAEVEKGRAAIEASPGPRRAASSAPPGAISATTW